MEIKKNVKYQEGYLPTPRCRKLRYRDAEEEITINIIEITKKEAPTALILHNYDNTKEEYKYYNNKLWTKLNWNEKHSGKNGLLPVEELHWYIRGVYAHWNYTKEEVIDSYIENAKQYIIIDDVIYIETGEPRYVSMTFGLGHNHGGTSLMIDNYYNSNISKECYFNALEREKAIEFTRNRAIRRGDTNDVDRIGKSYNIEVLIPEVVKCNPQIEHGDGDPFINSLYKITENTDSTLEAGLLVMAFTSSELARE